MMEKGAPDQSALNVTNLVSEVTNLQKAVPVN